MGRVYNNLRAVDVAERERPAVVNHTVHEARDAAHERRDLHQEIDPNLFINPTSLRAPAPRPGFVQRWISDGYGMSEESRIREHQRFLNKQRQGWAPRDPSTVSDAERRFYLTAKAGSPDDMIRVAGLVLCEMPVNVARQRIEALSDVNRRQRDTLPQSTEELRQGARGTRGIGELQVENETNTVLGRPAATMAD